MERAPLFSPNLTVRTWRAPTASRAEVARRLSDAGIKCLTKIEVTRRGEVSKKLSSMGLPCREGVECNDGVGVSNGSTSGHEEVHIDDVL